MPLPAFLLAAPAFLVDIAPSLAVGFTGGLISSSLRKKPTTMEKVEGYVDRYSKFANAIKLTVDMSEHFFRAGNKTRDAENISEKLQAEADVAKCDRELRQIAIEKAKLELEAMKNGDMPWASSEVPPEAGLGGVPTRKRTAAKKPTPQVRRTA